MFKFKTAKAKIIAMVICDLLALTISIFLSAIITNQPWNEFSDLLFWACLNVVFMYVIYSCLNLYSFMFTNVSTGDGIRCVIAVAIIYAIDIFCSLGAGMVQLSTATIMCGFLLCGCITVRFSKRLMKSVKSSFSKNDGKTRVMIIGGGDAGSIIIREILQEDKIKMIPVCILDDDITKKNKYIMGVKIVGNTTEIEKWVEHYNVEKIIVAMPSASQEKLKDVYLTSQKTNCKVQTLPSLYQLVSGEVLTSKIRDVDVIDLLGREEINIDLQSIMSYITNKTILVTGGGGSIGSELCRQIAKNNPKQLIILDIYENNAYDIEQELKQHCPNLNLVTLIASIRDVNKIEAVFKKYRPNIVFNAAAHKHVPLMENSPLEAIKNNVFGALNLSTMADKYKCEKFVQISTDKAVNPTNIMGASKRMCEMIIQSFAKKSKTDFVAVRFGNVLGSNGSVIPLFKKQIAEGGPVTVTHKDIIRYFMTIEEAVSLVLQAGSFAKGGEIFVLDMGEPVKIYDLAYNLIKLSGFEPNVDIQIVCTGLRPGEKLYEERLMAEEGLEKTSNNLINIGRPIQFDEKIFFEKLTELKEKLKNEDFDIKKAVSEIVTNYKYQK